MKEDYDSSDEDSTSYAGQSDDYEGNSYDSGDGYDDNSNNYYCNDESSGSEESNVAYEDSDDHQECYADGDESDCNESVSCNFRYDENEDEAECQSYDNGQSLHDNGYVYDSSDSQSDSDYGGAPSDGDESDCNESVSCDYRYDENEDEDDCQSYDNEQNNCSHDYGYDYDSSDSQSSRDYGGATSDGDTTSSKNYSSPDNDEETYGNSDSVEEYLLLDEYELDDMADREGWTKLSTTSQAPMASYRRDGTRLNFWLSTGTVGSYLEHPRQGKTQLFRRGTSMTEAAGIFENPRLHTGRGYQRRPPKCWYGIKCRRTNCRFRHPQC